MGRPRIGEVMEKNAVVHLKVNKLKIGVESLVRISPRTGGPSIVLGFMTNDEIESYFKDVRKLEDPEDDHGLLWAFYETANGRRVRRVGWFCPKAFIFESEGRLFICGDEAMLRRGNNGKVLFGAVPWSPTKLDLVSEDYVYFD